MDIPMQILFIKQDLNQFNEFEMTDNLTVHGPRPSQIINWVWK